jgi:hypothetical protein
MKCLLSFLLRLTVLLFLVFCLAASAPIENVDQPQLKTQKTIKGDIPVITSFTIRPSKIYPGFEGTVMFSWRVTPAPGGSPISRITITRASGPGPNINYTSTSTQSRKMMSIPASIPAGTTTYVLLAENTANKMKNASVTLESGTTAQLAKFISITDIGYRSGEIRSDEDSFDLKFKIRNTSGVDINGCYVSVSRSAGGPTGTRVVGELRDKKVGSGHLECTVRVSPVGSEMGYYDIKIFKDRTLLAQNSAELQKIREINIFRIRERR